MVGGGSDSMIMVVQICVTNLTKTILERQSFDAKLLHSMQLLFVKVFQLVHGQVAIPVQVHTSEPECNVIVMILRNECYMTIPTTMKYDRLLKFDRYIQLSL